MSPLSEQALLKATDLNFDLLHLSPTIGTEVHGIDIGADLDSETIDVLSNLLVERKVIFFETRTSASNSTSPLVENLVKSKFIPLHPTLKATPK